MGDPERTSFMGLVISPYLVFVTKPHRIDLRRETFPKTHLRRRAGRLGNNLRHREERRAEQVVWAFSGSVKTVILV